jgi:hypothetical protein
MNKLQPLLDKYDEKCSQPSDINELLPYLYQYATLCETICEMGVRNPTSTYAFLAANPKKLVSYDIARWELVDEAERLAKECGVNFEFILQDVLEADIEETDFLFIDTLHDYSQLKQELARHSGKVRKYIGFHDTTSFEWVGEPPYEGIKPGRADGIGIWPAIQEVLDSGEWILEFRTTINNGLTVIRRG